MMKIEEIQCKEACHKLKNRTLSFFRQWDLNIYRGCQHGCAYCFAMYSHKYLDNDDFYESIYVKVNIVEQLERLLQKPSWKREIINIGGVTDSYQPLEAQYKFMPEILKLLIKYKTPCIISTKSDLVLRDIDLIEELSHITYINVSASIISLDENLRKKIEPKGSPYEKRFKMLKELSKTNASTGVYLMPVIPFLTDSKENLEEIYYKANKCDVRYILARTLNLRGGTRGAFFEFIKREYPTLFFDLIKLYNDKEALSDYKINIRNIIKDLESKYNLTDNYDIALNEKIMKNDEYSQISLFE